MIKLVLSNLKSVAEEFTPAQCSFYGEACAVAFQKNKHTSETIVSISGVRETSFTISWEKISSLSTWIDNDVVAENAAIAMAIFLVAELTDYTIVRQTSKGPGFDYWLGYKKNHPSFDPDNFFLARLEISGIFNGDSSALRSRVQVKLKQVDRSKKLNLPAYIAVTEFGNCNAMFVKK